MDSMERRTRAGEVGRESGFTLAALLVILSVIMIVVTYTVPRQWSAILQRDRERQTIFAMQQYARACYEFNQRNNKVYPVSPQQLKEARSPRFMRGVKGDLIDPLTGEVDWLVIPQAAAITPSPAPNPPTTTTPQPKPVLPGVPLKDYAGGPFVGVRPPVSGKSMLSLNGNDSYETWNYTALDLTKDIQLRLAGLQTVWK